MYSYVEIQFQTFIITENALHDVTQNEKKAKCRRREEKKTLREHSKAKQRRINEIEMKAALHNKKNARGQKSSVRFLSQIVVVNSFE